MREEDINIGMIDRLKKASTWWYNRMNEKSIKGKRSSKERKKAKSKQNRKTVMGRVQKNRKKKV